MDLEKILRTDVEMVMLGEPEMASLLSRLRSFRSVVIGEIADVTQQEQTLAVVRLRAWRFVHVAGDVIVDGRDARRVRMPVRHALHRSEPGKGQEVAERIHADVLVKQNVELQRLDQAPGGWKVPRHVHAALRVLTDEARILVIDRGREKNGGHVELVPRELCEQSSADASDTVVVKELRDQSDAQLFRRHVRRTAMLGDVVERWEQVAIHPGR